MRRHLPDARWAGLLRVALALLRLRVAASRLDHPHTIHLSLHVCPLGTLFRA